MRSIPARNSVGANSRFNVQVNGQAIAAINLPAVTGNFLDAFATENIQAAQLQVSTGNIQLNYTYTPGSKELVVSQGFR